MNEHQRSLYERIEAFPIGNPGAALPFAARLARDNGWPLAFAERVVADYRKFVFLAIEAGHPVTPSDEVDQAWHLHLVYTESYWDDFCAGVLGRPLHHGPTRGGKREGDKFTNWYARTLESYARFFGNPPADIWPPSAIRFGRAPFFRRVNSRENWIIPKRRLNRTLQSAALATIGATALVGCGVLVAQTGTGVSPTAWIIGGIVVLGLVVLLVSAVANGTNGGSKGRRQGGFWGGAGCGHSGGSGCGTSHSHHGHSDGGGSGDSGSDGGGSGCGSSGCGGGGCGGGGD